MIKDSQVWANAQPLAYDWLAAPGAFGATLAAYTSLHANARGAIYWALRGLNLPPETVVKMPAYHCGREVQAVIDAGLKVEFYRIRPDLTIDLDDLGSKLEKRPGPVLVIHYFGFGQPDLEAIDKMCTRLGVPWLEDCAHALFSKRDGVPLGTCAPLAAFSLVKSLAVFEGGALTVNPQKLKACGLSFAFPANGKFCWGPYRFYLREMIRGIAEWRPTVFGLMIIILLLLRPDGLLAFRISTLRRWKRTGNGAASDDSSQEAR